MRIIECDNKPRTLALYQEMVAIAQTDFPGLREDDISLGMLAGLAIIEFLMSRDVTPPPSYRHLTEATEFKITHTHP